MYLVHTGRCTLQPDTPVVKGCSPPPSLCRLGLVTKLFTLNPKATTVVELYGVLDPITRDWTDGLLSNIFREINKPTEKNERKYILFDGDVDTLWVESMNSVMDDNKLLTLANGERIRLQKHCALLVEVGHRPLYLNIFQCCTTHLHTLLFFPCALISALSHFFLVCISTLASNVLHISIARESSDFHSLCSVNT